MFTTSTIVIYTNLEFNSESTFNQISAVSIDYVFIKKDKKKLKKIIKESGTPSGTIISCFFKGNHKGTFIRDQKKNKNLGFRNAIAIDMVIGESIIHFKIFEGKKIQMAGCKCEDEAIECIRYLWKILTGMTDIGLKINSQTVESDSSGCAEFIIRVVMANIIHKFEFGINRKKLHSFINRQTDYRSMLQTVCGYSADRIVDRFKIPNWFKMKCITIDNEHNFTITETDYCHFLSTLNPTDFKKEQNKIVKMTCLVFYNGVVIVSGIPSLIQTRWENFKTIISSNVQTFETENDPTIPV
jgi:hypothetical protein